jgi:hypothetical protein
MKRLLFILVFIIPFNSFSQTYYNPEKDINLNLKISIKNPYSIYAGSNKTNINYSDMATSFNNNFQLTLQKRADLKRYYDEIWQKTKQEINYNTYLTPYEEINVLIYKLKESALTYLDADNYGLKRGWIKPNEYEQAVPAIFNSYINVNQLLLNLARFKYEKMQSYKSDSEKEKFNILFKKILSSIKGINTTGLGGSQMFKSSFHHPKVLFESNESTNTSKLYEFVVSSVNGNYESYLNAYKNFQVEESKKRTADGLQQKRYKLVRDSILKSREKLLLTFSKKEKSKFKKSELNYLLNSGLWAWKYKKKYVPKRWVKPKLITQQETNFEKAFEKAHWGVFMPKLEKISDHMRYYFIN